MDRGTSTGSESADTDGKITASVDESGDADRFVLEDASNDDAWLSALASQAPSLDRWR